MSLKGAGMIDMYSLPLSFGDFPRLYSNFWGRFDVMHTLGTAIYHFFDVVVDSWIIEVASYESFCFAYFHVCGMQLFEHGFA